MIQAFPAGDEARLDRLLSALLDQTLTDEEFRQLNQRLADDAAARRLYLDYLQLHEDLATSAVRSVMDDSPGAPGDARPASFLDASRAAMPGRRVLPLRRRILLVATAAALLLAGLWWQVARSIVETGLIVASADGPVSVERDGRMLALHLGDELSVGDVVHASRGGIVAAYVAEETRLELSAQAQLKVLDHQTGKRLRLLAGSLSADVAMQPEERPLRLFLADAEAVVLGTRFTLSADGDPSLEVQEGAVRVNRAEPRDSVVVNAQEKVALSAPRWNALPEQANVKSPWRDEHTLRIGFDEDGPRPRFRVGRVTLDPLEPRNGCVAGELYLGDNPHLKFGVSLVARFIVEADSRLRVRYWAGPDVEMIQMVLHCEEIGRAHV